MGIETALLSSWAGTGLGASIGGAMASMGTLGTISTGLSIFSGLSSMFSGAQTNAAYQQQSALAMQQAQLAGAEQARVAFREAGLEKEEYESTRRAQKVAYLASGVDLEGTPLLVMEETTSKGEENVNEILMAGQAGKQAALAEGRVQAANLQASGREAFSSGLSSGFSSLSNSALRIQGALNAQN